MPAKPKQRRQPPIRLFAALLVIGLVAAGGIVIVVNQSQTAQPAAFVQPTLDATVRANLTALPNAPTPDAAGLQMLGALRHDIQVCADFSQERRDQMLQHITWMENPQQIPPDIAFAMALGGTVNNRLIYGMAIFTSTEWRLLQRPADSCLIDIGLTLNDLLTAVGEAPITIYDE